MWVTVSDPGRLLESVCACVCVACPLLPVSVTRVSPVCPRSSAQSGWVWAHAGDACVACPLLPVSVTRVSPVCPRSSAQSGWVWAHAGDACTTAFLFRLLPVCYLPAACCLLPAACLLPAMCCVFPPLHFLRLLWQHLSHFLFYTRACPRVFSAHLIFSHPPSRGRAAPNSTHSHVFSPCDSMTSSHLTSSLC